MLVKKLDQERSADARLQLNQGNVFSRFTVRGPFDVDTPSACVPSTSNAFGRARKRRYNEFSSDIRNGNFDAKKRDGDLPKGPTRLLGSSLLNMFCCAIPEPNWLAVAIDNVLILPYVREFELGTTSKAMNADSINLGQNSEGGPYLTCRGDGTGAPRNRVARCPRSRRAQGLSAALPGGEVFGKQGQVSCLGGGSRDRRLGNPRLLDRAKGERAAWSMLENFDDTEQQLELRVFDGPAYQPQRFHETKKYWGGHPRQNHSIVLTKELRLQLKRIVVRCRLAQPIVDGLDTSGNNTFRKPKHLPIISKAMESTPTLHLGSDRSTAPSRKPPGNRQAGMGPERTNLSSPMSWAERRCCALRTTILIKESGVRLFPDTIDEPVPRRVTPQRWASVGIETGRKHGVVRPNAQTVEIPMPHVPASLNGEVSSYGSYADLPITQIWYRDRIRLRMGG
ncbi:hypothetical protein M407DRAFT_5184 [Tulasnella calospora MUT 4182]|uniref:Uncharacterized protein n=1 Tax=Tulasnella calospora MUT 4182 TaxID=1051891 RepID=A0A0C3QH75_9AGAM|nr:hypothetical protein M407DRAFT_5184 [Tulasnella calospora MUT 4182]